MQDVDGVSYIASRHTNLHQISCTNDTHMKNGLSQHSACNLQMLSSSVGTLSSSSSSSLLLSSSLEWQCMSTLSSSVYVSKSSHSSSSFSSTSSYSSFQKTFHLSQSLPPNHMYINVLTYICMYMYTYMYMYNKCAYV